MKIDKVIFSFDGNPLYEGFWSIQAELVRKVLKAEPVLFLICDEDSDFYFDGHGLVKKFNKDRCFDIITSFQSQIIRMYGTKYFPNEVCLTADIDMLMLNEDYFLTQIKNIPDDDLVIYDSKAYDMERPECDDPSLHCHERYPICYIAGKGTVFNKILDTDDEYSSYVDRLQKLKLGWGTDEIYFAKCLKSKTYDFQVHKLERGYKSPWIADRRINRHNFPVSLKYTNEISLQNRDGVYDLKLLSEGYYIDAHCPRPYSEYKKEIDFIIEVTNMKENFMKLLGEKYKTDKILHHRYDRIYPRFLENFRDKELTLLEIGCGADFASFNMWQEYFLKGKIYCMDINEELTTDRGGVIRADQTKLEDLEKVLDIVGPCEIIIDDGSHIPYHQIETFNFLFEKMLKKGGVYIIEDIECSYWNPKSSLYGYEIGYFNLIDYLKSVSDKVNQEFSGIKNHQNISSITFFKNCVIICKMSDEEIAEKDIEYRFKFML